MEIHSSRLREILVDNKNSIKLFTVIDKMHTLVLCIILSILCVCSAMYTGPFNPSLTWTNDEEGIVNRFEIR